jgi:hypothetical protein
MHPTGASIMPLSGLGSGIPSFFLAYTVAQAIGPDRAASGKRLPQSRSEILLQIAAPGAA